MIAIVSHHNIYFKTKVEKGLTWFILVPSFLHYKTCHSNTGCVDFLDPLHMNPLSYICWKAILIFLFTEWCHAMFVFWLVLFQKASMRLTINIVLLEGLIDWEIGGWWSLTLKHRKKRERWSEGAAVSVSHPFLNSVLSLRCCIRVRSVFCPWETWSTEKVDKKGQGGKWSEIGAKGRIPMSAEMNKIEIGGRRMAERKEGKRVKKEHDPKFSLRQGINQRWCENTTPLGSLFFAFQARSQIVR